MKELDIKAMDSTSKYYDKCLDETKLYIKELGIGIRIEDDILVTKTGNMNLTISIPKNAAEIERLLGSRG